MLEVENNLDKKINHKKEIIRYISIAIDCLEKANGNVANAIDNLGDSLVESRESKIDTNQLCYLDDTTDNIKNDLHDMEYELDSILESLREDLKKFQDSNV
jgi:histidyl-tRNA synthetase